MISKGWGLGSIDRDPLYGRVGTSINALVSNSAMKQLCINFDSVNVEDVKLKELEALNLPRVWREIYKITGAETFVKVWHVVSNEEYCENNRLYIPSVNKYYEYQNMQFIKSLIKQGLGNSQICDLLPKHNIEMSKTKVVRLRKKFNLPDVN